MRPTSVVSCEPVPEPLLGLSRIVKVMLPDAFLFETAEEPFDGVVLFRRIRRDEFLRQTIVAKGRPEPAALRAALARSYGETFFSGRCLGPNVVYLLQLERAIANPATAMSV